MTTESENTESVERRVLSVQEIMTSDDLRREEVETPEWGEGGYVVVQEITKRQMNELRRIGQSDDQEAFERELFMAGVVEPAFSPEQYQLLLGKSNKVVQRVMDAIMELSKVAGDEDEEAQEKAVGSFPS